ncbi:MAG: hypothetical protein LQ345_004089 [Seirophora villosa]|nr:MAG: hypothetical protein LQ345_004089 [Seirophora villosa]
MATPNPSYHKPAATPRPPTSASAMTPASISASSPAAPPSSHSATGAGGYRSHPSPAPSSKAGKSPFAHLQQAQHPFAAGSGAQPMSRSGTNTSSPDSSARMGAAFAGLNGMLMQAVAEGGVAGAGFKTGLTPAGMTGTTPGVLSPLPSHLAGSALGNEGKHHLQRGRDQEEERRARLEDIVRVLGERWGYVSREGVERCARRVGLECLWEDEQPGAQGRTLSIAGNSVLVDVLFLGGGDEVGGVHLGFPEREEGEWSRSAGVGAEALKKDLKGEEGVTGYVGLENFVGNLERLARLDRLGTGGVNCFDAVEGVGGALRKMWEIETTKKREEKREQRQEDIETEVLCKGSGRPVMHASDRLGQTLQYWQASRHITGRKRSAEDMDMDTSPEEEEESPTEEPQTWSASIECEPSSSDLYPSIRISSDWVTAANDPPADQQQQNPFISDSPFTWHDPPPTLITSSPNAMNLDLSQPNKTPDVRFIARLHPPVLVPLQTALNIYASVGAPLSQDSIQPTTFDSLLFSPDTSPSTNTNTTTTTTTTERTAERELYTPPHGGGTKMAKKHHYTLFTDPQAYARLVAEIPFAHPRQIVQLLPVLRQWAFVSSLLRQCFFSSPLSPPSSLSMSTTAPNPKEEEEDSDAEENDPPSPSSQLANLLNLSSPSSPPLAPRRIDISLSSLSSSSAAATTTTPQPRFRLAFERGGELVHVAFCVGGNAEVGDVEVCFVEGRGGGGRAETEGEDKGGGRAETDGGDKEDKEGGDADKDAERKEKVRRVVELGEDLGVLVEWIVGE